MRVEVIDSLWRKLRALASSGHRTERGLAIRVWLRQMIGVGGCAIAHNFAQNVRLTVPGVLERFQGHEGRAFPQGQPVAVSVERAALGRLKRLQRIESG